MRLLWRIAPCKPPPAPLPPAPLPPAPQPPENTSTNPGTVIRTPCWKKLLHLFFGLASILTLTVFLMPYLCFCSPLAPCQEGRQPECGAARNKDPCTKNCVKAAGCVSLFLMGIFYLNFRFGEINEDLAVARSVQPEKKKLGLQSHPQV